MSSSSSSSCSSTRPTSFSSATTTRNKTTTTPSNMNHLVVYASGKGTKESDQRRSQIDAIIYRLSKHSTYYTEQLRKDALIETKIHTLKAKLQAVPGEEGTPPALFRLVSSADQVRIDQRLDHYRVRRRHSSAHVVVDMDAFYFACHVAEQHERGNSDCFVEYPKHSGQQRKLHEIPAAVGGGVITTSNYVARKYGVRSAMAGFIANQLVKELGNSAGEGFHELHYVKSAQEGNRTLYQRKSAEVRQILVQYDPQLKCYSLDECYMNLQPYVQLRYGLRVDADNGKRKNTKKNKKPITVLSHEEIQHYWTSQREKEENQNQNNNKENDETNTNTTTTNEEDDDENDESDSSVSDEDIGNTDPTTRNRNPMIEYDQRVQEIVHEMRNAVETATHLTCSAGIGPNFMLAKIASDLNKPNGQYFVPSGDPAVMDFLSNLSTRQMSGIGRVSQKMLSAFEIHTLGDLYAARYLLPQLFGGITSKSTQFLHRASIGWQDDDHDEETTATDNSNTSNAADDVGSGGQKSVSCENTFRATTNLTKMITYLGDIVQSLTGTYMIKTKRKDDDTKDSSSTNDNISTTSADEGATATAAAEQQQQQIRLKGKTITLRIKLSDYQRFCRSKTLPYPVSTYEEIYPIVVQMLRVASTDDRLLQQQQERTKHSSSSSSSNKKFEVRLLGVAVSNLVHHNQQQQQQDQQQQTLLGLWNKKRSPLPPPKTANDVTQKEKVESENDKDHDHTDDTITADDEELVLSHGSTTETTIGGYVANGSYNDEDAASLKLAQDLQREYTAAIQKQRNEEESSRKLAEQFEKEERKKARISQLFQKMGASSASSSSSHPSSSSKRKQPGTKKKEKKNDNNRSDIASFFKKIKR